MSGLLNFAQSASNAVAGNIGGPVDLISMALRAVGTPIPDAPIGSTEWMRRNGLVRDVEQGPARVLGETAGLLGPAMVSKFAPQIAGGLLQAGDNLAAPSTLNKQAGMALFDITNLPNRGRDLIRSEAERLAEMLQKNGFAANIEHGGSIAGPSSYLQISDPITGRFFKTPVRLSGHAKGAYNSQSVWDVNSSEFGDVLAAAEKMRATGKSVTVQIQEHAEKLISEGVKPKAAHRVARELFTNTQR